MAGRKHLIAVNRAIRASALDENGLDAPTIELLRDLARQLDNAGPDGPSLNLLRLYLSATKDLARATNRRTGAKRAETSVESPSTANSNGGKGHLELVEPPPLNQLQAFRKKHKVG